MNLNWLKASLFIHQFVFVGGAYLVFLFTFIVPIILGAAAQSLVGDQLAAIFSPPVYNNYLYSYTPVSGSIVQLGFGLLILFLIFGVLLVPYLLLTVLWRALDKARRKLAEKLPANDLFSMEAIFAALIITVSLIASYQPAGNKMLDKLVQISGYTNFADKEKAAAGLNPNEEKLRQVISDLETARYRYLMSKDDTALKYSYGEILHFGDGLSGAIQSVFLTAAYPLVYQGSSDRDQKMAANFYYLFGYYPDSSKQTASSPIIKEARNVLLSYKNVKVETDKDGLTAKVTITEEYENKTYSQQEVSYEFSLPMGAVMTDLNLGPNLEFPGVIAPKGAAQSTYQRELQIGRDPALLEETGPHQYRLRIFPIPSKSDLATLSGRNQKMSFSYTTELTPQGFPLPNVTKKTNVYANAGTEYVLTINGINLALSGSDLFVKATDKPLPDLCQGNIIPANNNLVLNVNYPELKNLVCAKPEEIINNISGAKIAIIYDVSYDNKSPALEAQLGLLGRSSTFLKNNQVDLYKYNDMLSPKVSLSQGNFAKETKFTYFGHSNGLKALGYFNEKYDLVMIFPGKDALAQEDNLPFASPTQIFVILPQAGSISLKLESRLLQTRGDITNTVTGALKEFGLQYYASKSIQDSYVLNDYLSILLPKQPEGAFPTPVGPDTPLANLVNLGLYRTQAANTLTNISADVPTMDKFNAFAQTAGIATPYSSFIALVNFSQQMRLQQLEQGYNRYEEQTPAGFTGPIGNPIQPGILYNRGPVFSPVSSLFGTDLMTVNLGSTGESAGRSKFGGISNPYLAAAPAQGSILSGNNLFVWVNIVLLAAGLGIYLVRMLRKKTE